MKHLPLLPSDFKNFSWEESFGNATVEQLQQSYDAVTNKGYAIDFSKIVWNDLVDLLYKALTESGLTWDNTYGSYANIRMLDKYGLLTAQRFNAVTLNIETIINNSWKWAVDESVKGYLGRSRVYGYQEKWVQADYVYGWYIVELARVLNLLVDILKNEADFAELTIRKTINTNPDVELTPRPSVPLNVVRQILTVNDVTLLAKQSYRLNVLYSIRSNGINNLTYSPSKRLKVKQKSKTNNDVLMDIIKVVWTKANTTTKTDAEAPIRFGKSVRAYSDKAHKTNYDAKLIFSALTDFYVINRIKSNEDTALKYFKPTPIGCIANEHFTKSYSKLNKSKLYAIESKNQSLSNHENLLNYIPSVHIGSNDGIMYSNFDAIMAISKPIHFVGEEVVKSNDVTSLRYVKPTPIVSDANTHFTKPYSDIARIRSYAIESKNQSYFNDETLLNYIPSVHIRSNDGIIYSKPDANIAISKHIHFVGEEVVKSNGKAKVKLSTAVHVRSSYKSISIGKGNIVKVTPAYIRIRDEIHLTDISTINTVKSKVIKTDDEISTHNLTELTVKKVLDLYSNVKSFSKHIAELGFKESDESWVVKTGSNLYIKQVYSSEQKGNELFIDGNEWLEPIKNGSNLYIRQMYEELNNKED